MTRKLAKKHSRPWVHVDLDKVSLSEAVEIIRTWVETNKIEVLNVAGPRASKDPEIYGKTLNILRRVLT